MATFLGRVTCWLLVVLLSTSCLNIDNSSVDTVDTGNRQRSHSVATSAVKEANSPSVDRQQALEILFAQACVQQTTFTKYDKLRLYWPVDMPVTGEVTLRIMKESGRIYAEKIAFIKAGTVIDLGHAYVLAEGSYQFVIMPTLGEYYLDGLRITRKIEIEVRSRQEAPGLVANQC